MNELLNDWKSEWKSKSMKWLKESVSESGWEGKREGGVGLQQFFAVNASIYSLTIWLAWKRYTITSLLRYKNIISFSGEYHQAVIVLATLSWYPVVLSSLCHSFEDREPINFIYRRLIFKWIAVIWLKIGDKARGRIVCLMFPGTVGCHYYAVQWYCLQYYRNWDTT